MTADSTMVAADAVSAADLHAAMLAAFSDYLIGPFQIASAQWPSFLGRQAADLPASRVVLRDGRALAFALVAPRAGIGRWRLAAMGALHEARGSGAAPALLDDFIARAAAAGMDAVELECFAKNERALKLYLGRGFEVVQELRGWTLPAAAPAGPDSALDEPRHPAPREVDRATAFAWLAEATRRIANLPLQVTPPSLAAAVRPVTYWQLGTAQLAFSVVDDTPTQVHSLVDTAPAQRDARALVRALRSTHGGREITVPALQRDDLGGDALRREGFAPQEMHQVLMVRPL